MPEDTVNIRYMVDDVPSAVDVYTTDSRIVGWIVGEDDR